MLTQLEQQGVKLKRSKSHLFRPSIEYFVSAFTLGSTCVVSGDNVPHSNSGPSHLRSTCCGGRSIKGFAEVAAPLIRRSKDMRRNILKWGPEAAEAFQELKMLPTCAPILSYADFTKPFVLYMDGSL